MLQIDHVYEFLYQELFKDFDFWHLHSGVAKPEPVSSDILVFTPYQDVNKIIFFYDQEPYIPQLVNPYLEFCLKNIKERLPNLNTHVLVTSEYSDALSACASNKNFHLLYYFFHGFAALDWYRGYYSLNYNRSVIKNAQHDFISFNRIITDDRSYRIYFVSLLKEYNLLAKGLVSFGVTDDVESSWQDEVSDPKTKLSDRSKLHIEHHLVDIHKLVIDHSHIHGSASADIPRTIDSFWPNNDRSDFDALWHIVTETVFYYDKLHLTEKIFKPIVSKQPFMLLAAPGNLAYLKRYGFKTFDGIIDESYDQIQDNDARIEAVVKQISWYCNLSAEDKQQVIEAITPIVEYNFQHFYGEFKQVLTQELLDNSKALFKEIGYDDSSIDYQSIHHVLTK